MTLRCSKETIRDKGARSVSVGFFIHFFNSSHVAETLVGYPTETCHVIHITGKDQA